MPSPRSSGSPSASPASASLVPSSTAALVGMFMISVLSRIPWPRSRTAVSSLQGSRLRGPAASPVADGRVLTEPYRAPAQEAAGQPGGGPGPPGAAPAGARPGVAAGAGPGVAAGAGLGVSLAETTYATATAT